MAAHTRRRYAPRAATSWLSDYPLRVCSPLPHSGRQNIPVVATLLGPPHRGYQTIRFATLASASFDDQYLVSDGPINAKTNEPFGKTTKAYAEWLGTQTKEILSSKDYGFITKLQKSVWLHDTAAELLGDGSPEGVLRATYCDVPCQIRMDWFSPEYGLVDLKTCDSLRWFENDVKRFGYVFQMAFYHAIIELALDVSVPVHFIAVEKNEPFSTGVWELSPSVLEEAKKVNEAALARRRKCVYTGH